jgi:multiple sugar transport system permease protein
VLRGVRSDRAAPAVFLGPAVCTVLLVFLLPIALGVWTSFQADGSTLDRARWVGLANYAVLFGDPAFAHSVLVSVVFTAASVAGAYAAGLIAALILNRPFPGQPVLSGIVILPWAMPYVAAAMIWSWLFDYQYGLFNYLLNVMGVVHGKVGFLTDPRLALWAVVAVQIWKIFPLAAVLLLAGLKTIPAEHVDAARVDGAGGWGVFRHVTLPGLRPVTVVLVLLLTIWVFGRSFTVIYVMTGGGPVDATLNLVLMTFQQGFQLFHLSRAAALGTVVMCISAAFALVYLRFVEAPAV